MGVCAQVLPLARIDCEVDVYERVPADVGVRCSFISQGRNADEAWPNKLIISYKTSWTHARAQAIISEREGGREGQGGDTRAASSADRPQEFVVPA